MEHIRFCKKEYCEYSDMHKVDKSVSDKSLPYKRIEVGKVPKGMIIGIDATCNLRCPSCRNEIYVAKGKGEREEIELVAKQLLNEMDTAIEKVWFAGNGETFF